MKSELEAPTSTVSGEPIALPGARHWQALRDADGIVWLGLDRADESANSLCAEVLEEFGAALETIAARAPRGLVIHSRKPQGFLVGADIREFEHFADPAAAEREILRVHALFARLETLPFPTVARLHGPCLGGGLELALCCRHRVALEDAETTLGLPEILLGLHPGAGGTVRAIERLGVAAAMDLMLTGRQLDARRAQRLGLVDRVVPARHLDRAARALIMNAPAVRRPPWWNGIAATSVARPLVARLLRAQVAKRARPEHYPAPYALIELWERHGGDRAAMLRAEAASIARLFFTPTSRQLQRLFFLQERLKTFGKTAEMQDAPRVHVIGAGTMGGDIAAWCALRGCRVTLADREAKFVAPAIARAHEAFRRRLRDPYARAAAIDRLVVDLAGDGLERADIVVEAIVEDLAAKRALFAHVNAAARPEALLATNTSSIPLAAIAEELPVPARLVGVHFFNPVDRMQLVEIVTTPQTDPDAATRAAGFVRRIGRLPLPVASAPGFLVNRILAPYLQEAMQLHEEGVPLAAVDRAALAFGMPMGPLELADVVGLDVCLAVGKVLAGASGATVPAVLGRQVAAGRLGRKSGAGFYRYRSGKKLAPREAGDGGLPAADVIDRLVLRLVNEAVACLHERVVADADLLDVGMVFGTGFAPFRGGPIAYARERGSDAARARLVELAGRYGARFEPHPGFESCFS
ncbi:MAG: enoyl-CoA hydratase/isomerase family protein [Gammaproteobacteria bacterium]|nr:enoyl-CoA hydratase/isomerase family protein [Gammaproteobacteria bacterium]